MRTRWGWQAGWTAAGLTAGIVIAACGGPETPKRDLTSVAAASSTDLAPAPAAIAPAPQKAAPSVLAWDYLFSRNTVAGFYDADDDPGMNAHIVAASGGKGRLTCATAADWGKTVLVVPKIDFSRGPVLSAVVSDLDEGASWNVGVTSNPWSDANYHTVIPSQNHAGTVTADLAAITGWSGPRDDFNLVLVIEGKGKSVNFDSLHINYTK